MRTSVITVKSRSAFLDEHIIYSSYTTALKPRGTEILVALGVGVGSSHPMCVVARTRTFIPPALRRREMGVVLQVHVRTYIS